MSKHHRTAGSDYTEIKICGKTYTLRPLNVGVYASMESYIVSQKSDPLTIASQAVKGLPPDQHAAVWDAAMRQAVAARTVTTREAADFENSVRGLAWKVWRMLQTDHPEIDSVEASLALIETAGEDRLEEIARLAELASGEADLKKSSGPETTATPGEVQAGPSSTDN